MMDFEAKYNEAFAKANRINNLGRIYEEVRDRMQWNAMEYNSADEDHEDSWFSAPESDADYRYELYNAYCEVLEAIEKLASK